MPGLAARPLPFSRTGIPRFLYYTSKRLRALVTDGKSEFPLEAWIAQLRFEAETAAGMIPVAISWTLVMFVFFQIAFTLSLLPEIATPVQALLVMYALIFIGLVRAADDLRERHLYVVELRSILADVFLTGASVEEVAQRYQKLRLWWKQERGWWGFKPRPRLHPKA